MLSFLEKPRERNMPKIFWYHGPTGSGKTKEASRLAEEMHGDDVWWSGTTGRWWQGYDGHCCVILDDFRADFCKFHELLRWMDRNPITVECKGGSRQLRAKTFFVTTPYGPRETYAGVTDEAIEQLLRRIREGDGVVKHFSGL